MVKIIQYQFLKSNIERIMEEMLNGEIIAKINKIGQDIQDNQLTGNELTRMLYEQMLIGLRLNNF